MPPPVLVLGHAALATTWLLCSAKQYANTCQVEAFQIEEWAALPRQVEVCRVVAEAHQVENCQMEE